MHKILWVSGLNPEVWPFQWKLLSDSFQLVYYVLQGCFFEFVDEILSVTIQMKATK